MKRKTKINWRKSACCGADIRRVAGIWRCQKCNREINTYTQHKPAISMSDQFSRQYENEERGDIPYDGVRK